MEDAEKRRKHWKALADPDCLNCRGFGYYNVEEDDERVIPCGNCQAWRQRGAKAMRRLPTFTAADVEKVIAALKRSEGRTWEVVARAALGAVGRIER